MKDFKIIGDLTLDGKETYNNKNMRVKIKIQIHNLNN